MAQRFAIEVIQQALTECPNGLVEELLGHRHKGLTVLRERYGIPNHWANLTGGQVKAINHPMRIRWSGGCANPPEPITIAELDALVAPALAAVVQKPKAPEQPTAKPFPAEPPLDQERVFAALKLYAQDRGHNPTITQLAQFGGWSERQTQGAINRLRKVDRIRRDHESETFAPYREPRKHVGYGRERNATGFIPKEEIMNA